MTQFRGWALVVLCAAVLSGCSCDPADPEPVEDGGVDSGVLPNTDGGGDPEDAGHDAGLPIVVDPFDPENPIKDSDCDGLTDAEEFATTYAGGLKTDPANWDTDGDGILDGVELGRTSSVDPSCNFAGDQDPSTTTQPTVADTDGDGLSDGEEDANKNGRVDPGETDPSNPDTDGDGLSDGDERNVHGTDPVQRDTDADGISDGVEVTLTGTDPRNPDSDGDTCLDGHEDLNQNGVVDPGETDPNDASDCGPNNFPDADGDGIPDSLEDKNLNGVFEPALGETNWQAADTDGDGINDGVEDANKNGIWDPGETNPRRIDTDCDGLVDGQSYGGFVGEAAHGTDPTKWDTDGDGLPDGLEVGITTWPDATNCPAQYVDADPGTTTNPTHPDSDGDGIPDGAEDANQDGAFTPGELNPNDPADGQGPAGKVCTVNTIKPVLFDQEGAPDIQLGLPTTFTELTNIVVGGQVRGMMGYDDSSKVAFLVYKRAAPAGSVVADEAALRAQLGAVTSPVTEPFTSWDGHPALFGQYDQAGGGDVKTRANDLANALVGNGAGVLNGLSGVNGPFKVQMQLVRRSAQSLIVLVALVPTAHFIEPGIFTIGDLAGGSSLAQFGDANAAQCETFQPGSGVVDFLFVVDDSCSMADSQGALANAAAAVEAALTNSTLDWRVGMVTTEYHLGAGGSTNNINKLRGWTTNVQQFKAWLTQNSNCSSGTCTGLTPQPACGSWGGRNGGCWVTISGGGSEGLLGAARKAVNDVTDPGASQMAMRPGAELVVILLGDADDQTTGYTTVGGSGWENVQNFVQFFTATGAAAQTTRNKLNRNIPVHGIVCPAGSSCNGETGQTNTRHGTVISATSGIRGELCQPVTGQTAANCAAGVVQASINATINAIINSAIAGAGHQTDKPAIGASVKVAMDAVQNAALCNKDDIPRSRVNGFDYNGIQQTISFFGACRPGAGANTAAVSYRYWIDTTPNPDGNAPPCATDPYYDPNDPDFCQGRLECNAQTDLCVCPANCGGTPPPGMICNPNKLVCDFVCTPDCGGACTGYETCDTNSCSCACVQSASCPAGFVFQSGGGVCGCVCDTAALDCGPTFDANPNTCACECQSDCGGCPQGQVCNLSACLCQIGGIG